MKIPILPLNQDQTLIFSFFLKVKPEIIRELKHSKALDISYGSERIGLIQSLESARNIITKTLKLYLGNCTSRNQMESRETSTRGEKQFREKGSKRKGKDQKNQTGLQKKSLTTKRASIPYLHQAFSQTQLGKHNATPSSLQCH